MQIQMRVLRLLHPEAIVPRFPRLAVFYDVVLVFVFAALHSSKASDAAKDMWATYMPACSYRAVYILTTLVELLVCSSIRAWVGVGEPR